MKQTEIELLTKLFDTKAQDTQILLTLAMEDVRRTIAMAASNTDGQIHELNKTIKEHNGRLKNTEVEQLKQKKVIDVLRKAGKYWYVTAALVIIVILILIPVVEILGITGILKFLK